MKTNGWGLRIGKSTSYDWKKQYGESGKALLSIDSIKHNFMCCVDIHTKFTHIRKVKTLSSLQAQISFQEFQHLSPHQAHTVQADNGSGFFKTFHQYLGNKNIKHQFIYPKSPKINGVVERFNRTVQEEFIQRCDEFWFDLSQADKKLEAYLCWYNETRPHASLNYVALLAYAKQYQYK